VNAIQDGVGADSQRQMMEELAARMEARRLMAKERGKQRTLSA
jgi:hypothetical protein